MTLLREHDLGTPAQTGPATIELEIDGLAVTVPEGTSIMHAAGLVGIDVPRLCATDSLAAFGSCRLCLVEIGGRRGTPASCTTPVEAGMRVSTQTPRLEKAAPRRDGAVHLGPPARLPHVRRQRGLRAPGHGGGRRTAGGPLRLRRREPSRHHKGREQPLFHFRRLQVHRLLALCAGLRGDPGDFRLDDRRPRTSTSRVAPGAGNFLGSECVSCGACVQACPTATLEEKTVINLGVPRRSVITTCAYCGVGCSFKAELRGDEVVRMVPYKDGGANEGHSCVKGRFAWGYATHKERVLTPMVREAITDAVARGRAGKRPSPTRPIA